MYRSAVQGVELVLRYGKNAYIYIFSNHTVALGDNDFDTQVSYDAGEQPVDSKLDPYGSPNEAGTTSLETDSFTGVYPILYGMSAIDYLSSGDIYSATTKAIISL